MYSSYHVLSFVLFGLVLNLRGTYKVVLVMFSPVNGEWDKQEEEANCFVTAHTMLFKSLQFLWFYLPYFPSYICCRSTLTCDIVRPT